MKKQSPPVYRHRCTGCGRLLPMDRKRHKRVAAMQIEGRKRNGVRPILAALCSRCLANALNYGARLALGMQRCGGRNEVSP